jgi:glucosamine-6-phosphate deaminase
MMRIEIRPTAADAAAFAARAVAAALRRHPRLTLGLPTGRTSILFYDALVRLHRAGRADFRRARSFNLDELAGLGSRDPRSYRTFMREHLFSRVNLPAAHAHVLDGATRDWHRAIARFESALARAGGLDVVVLGLGRNGHVAFNEPADRLVAGCHRVRLTRATREANAYACDGNWRRVPTHGLTMGMGTLLGARRIVLLATGPGKAAIVRRAFTGPITTRVPASLLQGHPDVLVVCDADAARALRRPRQSL